MIKRSTLGLDFQRRKKDLLRHIEQNISRVVAVVKAVFFFVSTRWGCFLCFLYGLTDWNNQYLGRSGGRAKNIVVSVPLQRASGKRMGHGVPWSWFATFGSYIFHFMYHGQRAGPHNLSGCFCGGFLSRYGHVQGFLKRVAY